MSGQSPIDLGAGTSRDDRRLDIEYTPCRVTVTDTGSPRHDATVRAEVGDGQTVRFDGQTWTLTELHWHVPSEHSVQGKRVAIELHAVHKSADDSILVIGVLGKAGEWNSAAAPIFNGLPVSSPRSLAFFELDRLLPPPSPSYRYTGSLTTPPYSDGVQWIVLAEEMELSSQQIEAFRRLFPDGNARDLQPTGDRPIGWG